MNVGLYRDDGLAVLEGVSGPQAERARKDLFSIFSSYGLKITAESNLTGTDFLDVFLDLKSGKYRPWHKPNNTPSYVNAESNHPPIILKRIPTMIEKRISQISSDENEFNKSKAFYESALKRSGFNEPLKYSPAEVDDDPKPKRRRNILWFNPPFSKNVRTNVGRTFLSLVRKHFPTHHKLHKIFNKNNMKVSYSCMSNIDSIIKGHNSAIMRSDDEKTDEPKKLCNCRNPSKCPLDGECLASSVVYKATVCSEKEKKSYVGLVEGDFKRRWNNHNQSFRRCEYEKSTTLSSYVWSLRDRGCDFDMKWEILKRTNPYVCGAARCNLCMAEKVMILESDRGMLLNERSEILSKCRHKSKFLLCNLENGK